MHRATNKNTWSQTKTKKKLLAVPTPKSCTIDTSGNPEVDSVIPRGAVLFLMNFPYTFFTPSVNESTRLWYSIASPISVNWYTNQKIGTCWKMLSLYIFFFSRGSPTLKNGEHLVWQLPCVLRIWENPLTCTYFVAVTNTVDKPVIRQTSHRHFYSVISAPFTTYLILPVNPGMVNSLYRGIHTPRYIHLYFSIPLL